MGTESVLQRLKGVSQQKGGYLPKKLFKHEKYEDFGVLSKIDKSVIWLQSTAVVWLARCLLTKDRAINNGVKGLDIESVRNVCKLCIDDRNRRSYKSLDAQELVSDVLCSNISLLVRRVLVFFEKQDKLIKAEVNYGEFDFLTETAFVELKVLSSEMFSKWSLRVLTKYLIGLHESKGIAESFENVNKLIIFNAYTNESYICSVDSIPDETMYAVSHDVIGFDMVSKDVATWRRIREVGTRCDFILRDLRWQNLGSEFNVAIYGDGIYSVTAQDYWYFWCSCFSDRGSLELPLQFKGFEGIKFLKKNGYMMFIAEEKDKLYLLNGIDCTILSNTVEYYYQNMDIYADKVLAVFSEYWGLLADLSRLMRALYIPKSKKYWKSVYERLKSFKLVQSETFDDWFKWEMYRLKLLDKSRGKIHGCIVDIDADSHIFVNPNDLTVIPYSQSVHSQGGGLVFDNVLKLLKVERVELLDSYNDAVSKNDIMTNLIESAGEDYDYYDIEQYIGTDVYEASNRLTPLLQIYTHNLIQVWYDGFLSKSGCLDVGLYLMG